MSAVASSTRREADRTARSGLPEQNVGATERLASFVGGAALVAVGAARRSPLGAALAVVGGALALRGATGHCPVYGALGVDTTSTERTTRSSLRASEATRVVKSVTVNREPAELFAFWRNFGNLPRFMKNLESVEVLDGGRSRWRAQGPLGTTVEWEAEIINEVPGELVAWRSLEGSEVANAGSVHFERATNGRGTVVRVVMEYDPMGGAASNLLATLTGTDAERQVDEDLRRFKSIMEAGELPTTEGQPHGASSSWLGSGRGGR